MGNYDAFIKRMTQDIYPREEKPKDKTKETKKENKNGEINPS